MVVPLYRFESVITGPSPGLPGLHVCYFTKTPVVVNQTDDITAMKSRIKTFWESVRTGGTFNPGSGLASATRIECGSRVLDLESDPPVIVDEGTETVVQAPTTNDARTSPAVAALVKWSTALASRRGQGRTFLSPLQASMIQADGQLHAGAKDSIRQGAQSLMGLSDQQQLAIYGRAWSPPVGYQGKRQAIPEIFNVVTGLDVRSKLAVLTSRRD